MSISFEIICNFITFYSNDFYKFNLCGLIEWPVTVILKLLLLIETLTIDVRDILDFGSEPMGTDFIELPSLKCIRKEYAWVNEGGLKIWVPFFINNSTKLIGVLIVLISL